MGLNDQVAKTAKESSGRSNMFKDGIATVTPKADTPLTFRILPAFNVNDDNPETSWVPFIDPEGRFSDWAAVLWMARFVGSGPSTDDVISFRSFGMDENDAKTNDPITALTEYIRMFYDDWGYLDARQDKGGKKKYGCINRPSHYPVMNVWDLMDPQSGSKLAVLPPGAYTALFTADTGLAFAVSPNATEAEVGADHLRRYNAGDITDPQNGVVMRCFKAQKENKQVWTVDYARIKNMVDRNRPLPPGMLSQRVNLSQPQNFLEVPDPQAVVNKLVSAFSGIAPSGWKAEGTHEYELLRAALPGFEVPNAPSRPAARAVVQSGFGNDPADQLPMYDDPGTQTSDGVSASQKLAKLASVRSQAPTAPVAPVQAAAVAPVQAAAVAPAQAPAAAAAPAQAPAAAVAPATSQVEAAPPQTHEVTAAAAAVNAVAPAEGTTTNPAAAKFFADLKQKKQAGQ